MSTASMTTTGFRVGAVLGRSIWVLRRNAAVFGTLAVLFTWPTLLVSGDAEDNSATVSATGDMIAGSGDGAGFLAAIVAVVLVVLLIVLALYMLATSTMVYGTFQVLRGRSVGIGECLRRGLPSLLRVIGIAILTVLAILLVGALVSLPGIFMTARGSALGAIWIFAGFLITAMAIYSALWIAVPVAVVERSGVIASMRRSATLSKGNRWRIFGILLILTLLNLFADWIVTLPFEVGGTMHSLAAFAVAIAFTAWGAVAAAVAYHDLRLEKEGLGVNEIAAVFD